MRERQNFGISSKPFVIHKVNLYIPQEYANKYKTVHQRRSYKLCKNMFQTFNSDKLLDFTVTFGNFA